MYLHVHNSGTQNRVCKHGVYIQSEMNARAICKTGNQRPSPAEDCQKKNQK